MRSRTSNITQPPSSNSAIDKKKIDSLSKENKKLREQLFSAQSDRESLYEAYMESLEKSIF